MRIRLKLFKEWGITFGKPYEIAEQSAREVEYADRRRVEEEIIRSHSACVDMPEETDTGVVASSGLLHTQVQGPEVLVRTKSPVRIEHGVKLSRSTVKCAIADLEKSGCLRKEQRWRENGGKSSNMFYLTEVDTS